MSSNDTIVETNVEALHTCLLCIPVKEVNGKLEEQNEGYHNVDGDKPRLWCKVCGDDIDQVDISIHNDPNHKKINFN